MNREPVKDNEVLVSHTPVETEQIMAGLKTSADNAAIITQQLAEIAYKVNHGHGIIARLLGDSSLGNNLHATMVNLKKGSAGLNENMEAAKHNFLLKAILKRRKKKRIRRKRTGRPEEGGRRKEKGRPGKKAIRQGNHR